MDFVFKGILTQSPSALASLICSIQGWPEVQVVNQDFYPERALFYALRLYAQQLTKAQSYAQLQPFMCIHLLMFNLFADKRSLRSFKLKELETEDLLTNHLEISFLEVKKEFSDNHKRDPEIVNWMKFMKAPNEERMMLQYQEPFKSAYEELERLSKDPAKKWAYESAYKLIKDEESRLKDAGIAGEARGLAQGKAEGIKQQHFITISRMMKESFSIEQIAKLNDLTEDEVKAISEQLPPDAE